MKHKLLLTTALVATFGISNAYAEHTSLGDLVVNAGDTITNDNLEYNPDAMDEEEHRYSVGFDKLTVNGGTLDVYLRHMYAEEVQINAGNVKLDDAYLTTHDGDIHIASGNMTFINNKAGFGANNIDISGDAVLNLTKALIEVDTEFLLTKGTITLNDSRIAVESESADTTDSNFTINGGTINMSNSSYLLHGYIDDDIGLSEANNANLNGGTINIKSGNNYMFFKNINLGGTINIAENATLNVHDGFTVPNDINDVNQYTFNGVNLGDTGNINLAESGTINLRGKLVANVTGESVGTVGFSNSNAMIEGNVSGTNLEFNANHSLSKAITGTIGNLNGLLVVGNSLTYDKPTGSIEWLTVDEGDLDIGTNVVNATNAGFYGKSTLGITVTSEDKYGKIKASSVIIEDNNDTTLKVTMENGVISNGETKEFTFIDSDNIEGDFANKIAQNSRYEIESVLDDDNNPTGKYAVTGTATASDVVAESGGNANNAATAEAWDSMSTSTATTGQAKEVASALNSLSQNATTPAGKQAYVDALTALAPDVAPSVQQTATETAGAVFNAVGTRLSGSAPAVSKGMSSGDNPFTKVAAWVQGLFNKAKLDDTSSSKGFDSKTYGTAMGLEGKLDTATKLGVGYAYSKTDIDGFMRDTDVKTHTAILYGEYKPSNWYVNTVLSYGWSDYDEKKNVAGVGVKADWDVESFAMQLMTGYDMSYRGFGITPEVGLRYVHIKQDAYTDSADQRVSGNKSDIVTGVVGTKISKDFILENSVKVRPELKAAMTYDMKNDKGGAMVTLANGSSYAVTGKALDRFGIELGAGLTAEINDNVEFYIGYEGKFRDNYDDHTGLVNVKYNF